MKRLPPSLYCPACYVYCPAIINTVSDESTEVSKLVQHVNTGVNEINLRVRADEAQSKEELGEEA